MYLEHSGRCDRGYCEAQGWYFRVALPGTGKSFAWMYSIEDPSGDSDVAGVGAQARCLSPTSHA